MDTEKESFCFHPKGSAFTSVYCVVGKAQTGKQLVGLRSDKPLLHPIDAGKEADVLPHLEVFVEGELLTHIADASFYGLRLRGDVVPCHGSLAGGGLA